MSFHVDYPQTRVIVGAVVFEVKDSHHGGNAMKVMLHETVNENHASSSLLWEKENAMFFARGVGSDNEDEQEKQPLQQCDRGKQHGESGRRHRRLR